MDARGVSALLSVLLVRWLLDRVAGERLRVVLRLLHQTL